MTTVQVIDTESAMQLHEAFADLVYADSDLIQAEFDAIVEANWGSADPPSSAERSDMAGRGGPKDWCGRRQEAAGA